MQILLMFDARLEGCGCWQVLRHESRCNTSESAVNVSGGIVFNVSECAIVFCITKASLPKLFQIKPWLMLTQFNMLGAAEHCSLMVAHRSADTTHTALRTHRSAFATTTSQMHADAFHCIKQGVFACSAVVNNVFTALQKRFATTRCFQNTVALSRL